MGFFKRLADAVKSNTNAALDELEGKSAHALREQQLRELDQVLADTKQSVAKALAEQKGREAELKSADKELDLWEGRHRAAKQKGEERLIEAAAERLAAVRALQAACTESVEQQRQLVAEMRERLQDTDARIVQMKREILLAQAGVDAAAQAGADDTASDDPA